MEVKTTQAEPDRLLDQFAREINEERAASILSVLISEHVEPVVDSVLMTAPGGLISETGCDREDLKSEVVIKLLGKLKQYRAGPAPEPIDRFLGYVAVVAYNALNNYLRSKYPERSRLKNSIRYVLKHKEGLAIWDRGARLWLCGLERWRGTTKPPLPTGKLAGLCDDLARRGAAAGKDPHRRSPARLLATVFELADRPVELDDLVNVAATVWGIEDRDSRVNCRTSARCDVYESLASETALQDDVIEARLNVSLLWQEVRQLPQRQAMALLLALKDSRGVDAVSLLGNARVASVGEVAAAIGLEPRQLAGMWDELPMGDSTIASHLGITAQQVANLRKSARKRLAFRMRQHREAGQPRGNLIDMTPARLIKARRDHGVGSE